MLERQVIDGWGSEKLLCPENVSAEMKDRLQLPRRKQGKRQGAVEEGIASQLVQSPSGRKEVRNVRALEVERLVGAWRPRQGARQASMRAAGRCRPGNGWVLCLEREGCHGRGLSNKASSHKASP